MDQNELLTKDKMTYLRVMAFLAAVLFSYSSYVVFHNTLSMMALGAIDADMMKRVIIHTCASALDAGSFILCMWRLRKDRHDREELIRILRGEGDGSPRETR